MEAVCRWGLELLGVGENFPIHGLGPAGVQEPAGQWGGDPLQLRPLPRKACGHLPYAWDISKKSSLQ